MINKIFRDRHDAWVAINLGTRFSTRMITIGLLVHYLSVPEIAAWYIFLALFGLASLAEAGLGRVVTRQIAERFQASSRHFFSRSDLLFLAVIFRLYLCLLLILCVFAYLLGMWWFDGHIQADDVPWLNTVWLFFVLGNGISLYSALHVAALNGLGEVGISQKNETIASLMNLFIFVCVAAISPSLLAPTTALIVSTFVSLLLNHISLQKLVSGLSDFEWNFSFRYMKVITARIGPELGRYFFMLLSFHLLTSVFLLMLNHYEEAEVVASYGISMQLITLILTFSSIWLTSSFPKMAAEKGNRDHTALKQQFLSAASRGVCVLLLGMFVVAMLGDFLLDLIGSQVLLLPMDILLILMAVIATEYVIFTLLGQLLVSQAMLRFTSYSVVGSIIISLVALSLLEFGYGIAAIFIGRIIVFLIIIAIPIIKDTRRLFFPKIERIA